MRDKTQKNSAINFSLASPWNDSGGVIGVPFVRTGTDDSVGGQVARAQGHCRQREWNFRPDLAILDRPPRTAYCLNERQSLDQVLGVLSASGCVLVIEDSDRISRFQWAIAVSNFWKALTKAVSEQFVSRRQLLLEGYESDTSKRVRLRMELQRAAAESARRSASHWKRAHTQIRPSARP